MIGKILKWVAVGIGVVVALVVVAGVAVFVMSNRRIARRYDVPPPSLVIPTDSASIARGRHLAEAVGKCADCHLEGLMGGLVIDAGPFMTLGAPNLTRGQCGFAWVYTDADWVRAIRHGVARDSTALALMPAEAYVFFSDADLGALIAYLKTLPPVDFCPPHRRFGPIARLLLAQDKFPLFAASTIDHAAVRSVPEVPAEVSPAYGRYLAQTGGCLACHGPNLAGGPIPGTPPDNPPASNLTPGGIGSWTEEDFFRALREGTRPGGVAINGEAMPWRSSGKMTDDEIRAVWAYLRSVPPAEFGARPAAVP